MTLRQEELEGYRFLIDPVVWVDGATRFKMISGVGNGKNDFDPDSDFDLD